jgi:hypothetical protein
VTRFARKVSKASLLGDSQPLTRLHISPKRHTSTWCIEEPKARHPLLKLPMLCSTYSTMVSPPKTPSIYQYSCVFSKKESSEIVPRPSLQTMVALCSPQNQHSLLVVIAKASRAPPGLSILTTLYPAWRSSSTMHPRALHGESHGEGGPQLI